MFTVDTIRKAKVHLVLGSGGARGLAHIGVIHELEKLECEIISVSGCSMGAVIGGIYCTGKLPKFTDWMLKMGKLDVFSLMDFTLSASGLIKGRKVLGVIEELIGKYNIEDLDIPFTAVATDLQNQSEVHYTKGNLYNAIRASISIPSLLTPLIENDRLLIDGGVLNPLPISVVPKKNEKNNAIIVAVNLCHTRNTKPFPVKKNEELANKEYFGHKNKSNGLFSDWLRKEGNHSQIELPNIISILTNTIDLMQDKVIDHILEQNKPDILVNIRRDFAKILDFHLADKLIEEGGRAFHEAITLN